MTNLSTVLDRAKTRFSLGKKSAHGVAHWQRVYENGMKLRKALKEGDEEVITLFAFLHDCCRESDFSDPEHGPRAAEFAIQLREAGFIDLADESFSLLHEAISFHTSGLHHKDMTIAICWDADRLDIGRVGKKPRARYLSTKAAKDPAMIQWAYRKSC